MSKEKRELLNQLKNKQKESKELMNKEDVTVEEINAVTEEIKGLKAKIAALEEIEDIEDFGEGSPIDNDIEDDEKLKVTAEGAFVNAMKSVAGYAKVTNEEKEILNATSLTECIPEDGVLTVPQDIRTEIMELRRNYPDALENYVNVEKVNTLSGSRVIEKESDYVPFDNVDESADFP